MDKKSLRNMLQENKTRDVLEQLMEMKIGKNIENEIILLLRRLNNLNSKTITGVIDQKEGTIEENKINSDVILLLEKIEFTENTPHFNDFDKSNEINNEKSSNISSPILKEKRKNIRLNQFKNYYQVALFVIGVFFAIAVVYISNSQPIDCFDMLQIRNSQTDISSENIEFDRVGFKKISGFSVGFTKVSIESNNLSSIDSTSIIMEVTVIFEKSEDQSANDSILEYIQQNLPNSFANAHFRYKVGGESYIYTTFEHYYHNRFSIHAVFKSEPLNTLIIEQLKRKHFESITIFNSMFSLSPMMWSSPFLDQIDNEEALSRLNKAVKCLIEYEI